MSLRESTYKCIRDLSGTDTNSVEFLLQGVLCQRVLLGGVTLLAGSILTALPSFTTFTTFTAFTTFLTLRITAWLSHFLLLWGAHVWEWQGKGGANQ